MNTGTVKRFNSQKGYGFVTLDDNDAEEVFVHFSEIKIDGYKKLEVGQRVSYVLAEGPKGKHATNVQLL